MLTAADEMKKRDGPTFLQEQGPPLPCDGCARMASTTIRDEGRHHRAAEVGKSTLLNALTGNRTGDRSPIAGTTPRCRDEVVERSGHSFGLSIRRHPAQGQDEADGGEAVGDHGAEALEAADVSR